MKKLIVSTGIPCKLNAQELHCGYAPIDYVGQVTNGPFEGFNVLYSGSGKMGVLIFNFFSSLDRIAEISKAKIAIV